MRTLYILFLVATLAACHKNSGEHQALQQIVVGKWELRQSIGGIIAKIDYPPGNGRIIQFKNDDTYAALINNTNVYESGTYKMQSTNKPNEFILQITTNRGTSAVNINLNETQLVILPEQTCCDMQTNFYTRL